MRLSRMTRYTKGLQASEARSQMVQNVFRTAYVACRGREVMQHLREIFHRLHNRRRRT